MPTYLDQVELERDNAEARGGGRFVQEVARSMPGSSLRHPGINRGWRAHKEAQAKRIGAKITQVLRRERER